MPNDLPEDIADEVLTAWDAVEGLTLQAAYELFTEGLVTRPHAWAKHHRQLDLEASQGLDDARILGLALLALGELPTTDRRDFSDPRRQPWYRAYGLLLDVYRDEARFAQLGSSLAWLVIDALLDAGPADSRANFEQLASGLLWSMVMRRKADPRAVERRMIELAAYSFTADGYDTGSMDFDLAQLADHVDDPIWQRELHLRHCYLSYATQNEDGRCRADLQGALRDAAADGVDVAAICDQCCATIGDWPTRPLPRTAAELDT